MKVGLLGTGFGIAHARIYHTHPQVSEVVVFGRTPAKLQAFADEFGYATTTEVASIYDDPAVDLVHDLPPEVAGSVAQLLLVEALVGQGHATRVSVRLGAGRRGARRVRVEWQPPAWGGPLAPRVIEGNLRPGGPTST